MIAHPVSAEYQEVLGSALIAANGSIGANKMLTSEQIKKLEELGIEKGKYWTKRYFMNEKYRKLNVSSGSVQVSEYTLYEEENRIKHVMFEAHFNHFVYEEVVHDLEELRKVGIK